MSDRNIEKALVEGLSNMLSQKARLGLPIAKDAKYLHCRSQARIENLYEEFAIKFTDSPFFDSIVSSFRKVQSHQFVDSPVFKESLAEELRCRAVPREEIQKALSAVDSIVEDFSDFDKDEPSERDAGWNPKIGEIAAKTRGEKVPASKSVPFNSEYMKGGKVVGEAVDGPFDPDPLLRSPESGEIGEPEDMPDDPAQRRGAPSGQPEEDMELARDAAFEEDPHGDAARGPWDETSLPPGAGTLPSKEGAYDERQAQISVSVDLFKRLFNHLAWGGMMDERMGLKNELMALAAAQDLDVNDFVDDWDLLDDDDPTADFPEQAAAEMRQPESDEFGPETTPPTEEPQAEESEEQPEEPKSKSPESKDKAKSEKKPEPEEDAKESEDDSEED